MEDSTSTAEVQPGCCAKLGSSYGMRATGKFGCIPEQHRALAFTLSAVLICTAVVLTIVSAMAIDVEMADEIPWGYGHGAFVDANRSISGHLQLYVGLTGVQQHMSLTCNKAKCTSPGPCGAHWEGQEITVGNSTLCTFKGAISQYSRQEFSDIKCRFGGQWSGSASFKSAEERTCSKCKSTCMTSFLTVVGTAVFLPMVLYADYMRMSAERDSNCDKFQGALGNIMTGVATLFSFGNFATYCASDFPTHFAYRGASFDMSYDTGTGYVSLVVACFLVTASGIIHLCVPTPPRCWDELPCSELDPVLEMAELSSAPHGQYGSISND